MAFNKPDPDPEGKSGDNYTVAFNLSRKLN